MKLLKIALFILIFSVQFSFAQSEQKTYSSSWTLSTFPALDGVAQIRAEIPSSNNFAFSLISGGGVLDERSSPWNDKGPHPMFMLGAQVHYYLFGDFAHGMQIGAQTLFTTTNRDASAYYYRSGKNIYVAPYLGYKIILDPGFTLNAQAGVGTDYHRDFYATKIDIQTNQREGYYSTTNRIYVLAHLDFGWSF